MTGAYLLISLQVLHKRCCYTRATSLIVTNTPAEGFPLEVGAHRCLPATVLPPDHEVGALTGWNSIVWCAMSRAGKS